MTKTNAVKKDQTKKTEADTTAVVEKKAKVNAVLAKHDIAKLREEHKTKSSVIRFLLAEGHSRSDIAKALDIRYQHVRNVDVQVLKTKQD